MRSARACGRRPVRADPITRHVRPGTEVGRSMSGEGSDPAVRGAGRCAFAGRFYRAQKERERDREGGTQSESQRRQRDTATDTERERDRERETERAEGDALPDRSEREGERLPRCPHRRSRAERQRQRQRQRQRARVCVWRPVEKRRFCAGVARRAGGGRSVSWAPERTSIRRGRRREAGGAAGEDVLRDYADEGCAPPPA